MTATRLALALAVVLAPGLGGCPNTVDDRIDAAEYAQWHRKDTWGELPGHGGDTYRVIYANDVARTFEGGHYPEGSVLVKEVHDLAMSNGMPSPGALQYVAIMRRVGPAPLGLDGEGGWLFTEAKAPGGTETHYAYCWETCHVDAPFQGAWFDYSK